MQRIRVLGVIQSALALNFQFLVLVGIFVLPFAAASVSNRNFLYWLRFISFGHVCVTSLPVISHRQWVGLVLQLLADMVSLSCWSLSSHKGFNGSGCFLQHNARGVLSMANSGPNTNGSQFFMTYGKQPHLNGLYTIFGRVIHGHEVLNVMEKVCLMRTIIHLLECNQYRKFLDLQFSVFRGLF